MVEFLRADCATWYAVPALRQSFGCVAKMLFKYVLQEGRAGE